MTVKRLSAGPGPRTSPGRPPRHEQVWSDGYLGEEVAVELGETGSTRGDLNRRGAPPYDPAHHCWGGKTHHPREEALA